jgi:hypothetical protein
MKRNERARRPVRAPRAIGVAATPQVRRRRPAGKPASGEKRSPSRSRSRSLTPTIPRRSATTTSESKSRSGRRRSPSRSGGRRLPRGPVRLPSPVPAIIARRRGVPPNLDVTGPGVPYFPLFTPPPRPRHGEFPRLPFLDSQMSSAGLHSLSYSRSPEKRIVRPPPPPPRIDDSRWEMEDEY